MRSGPSKRLPPAWRRESDQTQFVVSLESCSLTGRPVSRRHRRQSRWKTGPSVIDFLFSDVARGPVMRAHPGSLCACFRATCRAI